VFAFHAEPRIVEGMPVGAILIGLDAELPLFLRRLPGVIWTTNHDLRITFAAGRIFDQDASNFVGLHVGDLTGTRDAREPALAHHLLAVGGQPQSFQYDFHERCYQLKLRPLRDDRDGDRGDGCVGTAVDITARRDAELLLGRSEARLATAQRIAHVGSFEWDIAKDRITWSDEMFAIYGLPKEGFDGTYASYIQRVHPVDRLASESHVLEALRTGRLFDYDHRIIRPDGTVRVLKTRGEVVKDENGKASIVRGACLDVTESRENTQKLERAISLLEAAFQATADALLVVDRSGHVVAKNDRFDALWRFPAHLLSSPDDAALLAFAAEQLEEPQSFRNGVRELYLTPERESFDVLRFKDGRVFERYSRPQRIAGEVVGRVWSFRDVSERERLLRNAMFLSEATRLLASLDIEPALDAVARLCVPWVADGCAFDLFVDGAPRRVCAVSRDPSRPFLASLPSSVFEAYAATFTVGELSCICVPLLSQGKPIGAMTFQSAPHQTYGEGDVELARTLAQRAALAVDNARLFHAAEEAVHSRDDFLSMVAHDIRTPLTAIRLATQALGHRNPSPELSRLLENIERQGRRLSRFLDDLLDAGRIRGGRFSFDFKTIDFAAVVREVVAEFGTELARANSALSVNTEGAIVGHWDRFRLEQVVTNLLSNAIKFGLGKPIDLTLRASEGFAVLTVRDQGPGIPEASRELLFEPFERAMSSRNHGGLGLGLYIVRTIVSAMSGTVTVESQEGHGATFTVRLPQRSVA
jgi:PAS domain S-box-containing protein